MSEEIQVLDKGYVRLVDVMGTDLSVVNAARVSYDKEVFEFKESDERLINFLAKHGHTSPFRHAFMTFEVYAPLMVARQWWKYIVGSDHVMDGWNESSRRYVTEHPQFYIPTKNEWRSAPENKKQGSGEPVRDSLGGIFTETLYSYISNGLKMYEEAMEAGICAEQARLFLPANGMYVRWRWSASVAAIANLINQRLAHDAQKEFQDYARAVRDFATEFFPISIKALTKGDE